VGGGDRKLGIGESRKPREKLTEWVGNWRKVKAMGGLGKEKEGERGQRWKTH